LVYILQNQCNFDGEVPFWIWKDALSFQRLALFCFILPLPSSNSHPFITFLLNHYHKKHWNIDHSTLNNSTFNNSLQPFSDSTIFLPRTFVDDEVVDERAGCIYFRSWCPNQTLTQESQNPGKLVSKPPFPFALGSMRVSKISAFLTWAF